MAEFGLYPGSAFLLGASGFARPPESANDPKPTLPTANERTSH